MYMVKDIANDLNTFFVGIDAQLAGRVHMNQPMMPGQRRRCDLARLDQASR